MNEMFYLIAASCGVIIAVISVTFEIYELIKEAIMND
jgi:hypothetical protein